MAYTQIQHKAPFTIDSYDAIGCGGVTTQSSDNKTYYMKVTVNVVGKLRIQFTAYPSTYVAACISRYSSINSTTGWPADDSSTDKDNVSTVYVNTSMTTARTYSIAAAGTVVYIYFRSEGTSASMITPIVDVDEIDSWDDHYQSLGTISSSRTITNSSVDLYTIYCYRVTVEQHGTIRFAYNNSNYAYMYLTREYDQSLYDESNGTISLFDYVDSNSGYYFETLWDTHSYGKTAYVWIRHSNGNTTSNLEFTIIPPGADWETELFDNATEIDGFKQWTVNAQQITRKKIKYVPVTFSESGAYTFNVNDRTIYYYLTSDIIVDSSGIPTNILGSTTSSSSDGFQFVCSNLLTSTTYYLMFRTDDGEENLTSFKISVSYGGGSSGNWYLQTVGDLGQLNSGAVFYQYHAYSATYTLYKYTASFNTSGTITFRSQPPTGSGLTPSDVEGWITVHTNTYDDINGLPPSSLIDNNWHDDDSYGNNQFTITASITAGVTYDFWFRMHNGSQTGYSYIRIIAPQGGSSVTWTYNSVTSISNISAATTTRTYNIDEHVGVKFTVSFASGGTASFSVTGAAFSHVYVTDYNDFTSSTGIPINGGSVYYGGSAFIQNISVASGTTYIVWIKGATQAVSGSVNFSISFTAGASADQWTYTSTSSIVDLQSSTSKSFPLTRGTMYLTQVSFENSGTARFYSLEADRTAWLTASNQNINSSTGIPNGTILASGGSSTGYDFSYASVIAHTTYYFWIRSTNYEDTSTIHYYFVAPEGSAPVTNDGKVYIYTGSGSGQGWKLAKPYIFTGSSWQPASAYVFNGSVWKKTKG